MSTVSPSDGPAQWIPLSQLRAWPRNYRRGNVEQIAQSIRRFGFNQALRVWKGTVMAGNHALAALKSMHEAGEPLPKGIVADPSGGWLAPCIAIDHLTESQAEAFAIADNAISDRSANDEAALLELLEELARQDAESFDATGFCEADLDRLAEDPEEHRIAGKSETTVPLATLKWGRTSVQISEEEEKGLDTALDRYADERGTSFGFARSLLGL
jgi:hypothetical protein